MRRSSEPGALTPEWVTEARETADYLAVYEARKAARLGLCSPPPMSAPLSAPLSAPPTSMWPRSPSPLLTPSTGTPGTPTVPMFQIPQVIITPDVPMTRSERLQHFVMWLIDRMFESAISGAMHFMYTLGAHAFGQR